ncbi:MAG: alcohol dehydrogenase catalytic domain-containing protein [Thermoprotei archaeon]
MRAIAVTPGKTGYELIDYKGEELTRGKVRLETLYVGICGTDKALVSNSLKFARPPPGEEKLVIGHEGLARVKEVGEGVSGLKEGDLVVPIVRRDGKCFHAKMWRADYCENDQFVEAGIRGLHGFQREEFVDVPEYLVKVKDPDLEVYAVLTEPMKNVMKIIESLQHVLTRYYQVCEDTSFSCLKAVISGFGTEGALLAMALKFLGIEDITVFHRSESEAKAKVAELLNLNYFVTQGKRVDLKGYDLFFDMTGSPQVVIDGVKGLNNNGVAVLFGTNDRAPSEVLSAEVITSIVEKNVTILGSVDGGKTNYEQALTMISYWHARDERVLKALIDTGVFKPEEFGEALKHSGLKAVIRWK